MHEVNKTLYIPLYAKAYVSKKGLFLDDKKAEQIWAAEGFVLKGKARSKWLAYYLGIRAAVFDEWASHQMAAAQNAVVIHIGCGLDSRVLRVGTTHHKWYDVDFAAVIDERKRYYSEFAGYHMIAGDVRDCGWLADIPETECAIVIMEGVSMYLTIPELQRLTANLSAHFNQIACLMDCYTVFAAKLSKYRNPIHDVGVTTVYGVDTPTLLEHGKFAFAKEHTITPKKYVNTLTGSEKYIFKKLYAGNIRRSSIDCLNTERTCLADRLMACSGKTEIPPYYDNPFGTHAFLEPDIFCECKNKRARNGLFYFSVFNAYRFAMPHLCGQGFCT